VADYEQWKRDNDNVRDWKIKYYKGLGTSSPQEAKDYFGALDRHRITFRWGGDADGDLLDMVFNYKKRAERRAWMMERFEVRHTPANTPPQLDSRHMLSVQCNVLGQPGSICVGHSIKELPISDFINKELIHFALAYCVRSIPSLVDGLKPGQRKILFTCLDKGLREEIRVAQLSGWVSLHSAYHHGEESLNKTIVGMAHDFVGSNNINLLHPAGNFGSRLQGGKDAASARYVCASLCDAPT
jgi:DNA topoisomerase-2